MNNSSPQEEDLFLLEEAVKGDVDAFNQLVMAYQDITFHYACSILKDPALAEEASQESFIKVYRNLSRFRGGSFRAWFFRIVTNQCYDVLRRIKNRPAYRLFPEEVEGEELDSAGWLRDPEASVSEIIERKEEANSLYSILEELPALYRNPLILVDMFEFDYKDAATALNIPLGTLKSRLLRARLRAREKLLDSKSEYNRVSLVPEPAC